MKLFQSLKSFKNDLLNKDQLQKLGELESLEPNYNKLLKRKEKINKGNKKTNKILFIHTIYNNYKIRRYTYGLDYYKLIY